jgi:hypothetical protein
VWPFFVPLYKGRGCAIGWISFTNRQSDNLNGAINWIKLPNPANAYYPDGLAVQSTAVGSVFVPGVTQPTTPADAKLQFSIPSGSTNGLVMSLKLSTSTGVFSGTVFNRSTGKPDAFQGALLQRLNTGYGFMLRTNQSALVTLTP